MNDRDMNPQVPENPPVRSSLPKPKGRIVPQPEILLVISATVIALLGYLLYDSHRFQQKTAAELNGLRSEFAVINGRDEISMRRLESVETQLSDALKSVGATHQELEKKTHQFQIESRRAKAELQDAIVQKADASQVEAFKQEANSKLDSVTSDVGGVKNEVGAVRTDLDSTRRDLEGTQRQLVDVRETLSAAVARNSSELAVLRAKGERDYFEFSVVKKNTPTKVADIALVLTRTDPKKGKYNVKIVADDNQLEKKDRTINEPVQFLVGHNMVRYELVVNWVQKDRVGGYLSLPKDKSLAAERVQTARSF
jgi:predicted  nucleic acid-binding Zn-ribbon protein